MKAAAIYNSRKKIHCLSGKSQRRNYLHHAENAGINYSHLNSLTLVKVRVGAGDISGHDVLL